MFCLVAERVRNETQVYFDLLNFSVSLSLRDVFLNLCLKAV